MVQHVLSSACMLKPGKTLGISYSYIPFSKGSSQLPRFFFQ